MRPCLLAAPPGPAEAAASPEGDDVRQARAREGRVPLGLVPGPALQRSGQGPSFYSAGAVAHRRPRLRPAPRPRERARGPTPPGNRAHGRGPIAGPSPQPAQPHLGRWVGERRSPGLRCIRCPSILTNPTREDDLLQPYRRNPFQWRSCCVRRVPAFPDFRQHPRVREALGDRGPPGLASNVGVATLATQPLAEPRDPASPPLAPVGGDFVPRAEFAVAEHLCHYAARLLPPDVSGPLAPSPRSDIPRHDPRQQPALPSILRQTRQMTDIPRQPVVDVQLYGACPEHGAEIRLRVPAANVSPAAPWAEHESPLTFPNECLHFRDCVTGDPTGLRRVQQRGKHRRSKQPPFRPEAQAGSVQSTNEVAPDRTRP